MRDTALLPDGLAADAGLGIVPAGYRLPAEARIGAVRLLVGDLERSLSFYQGVLGFRVFRDSGSSVTLSDEERVAGLIELVEDVGANPARPRARLGLYHFAVRLPDRPSLGRLVSHLTSVGELVAGADHSVNEAIYLQDPDGLGVEISVDRPRAQWKRRGAELFMGTRTLDRASLVRAAGDAHWRGMPRGTAIGHLHLYVGELDEAVEFYHVGLGLDVTVWSYPGALFLSAGGYHHHLGVNAWAGADARPADDDEARLLRWEFVLPDPHHAVDVAHSFAPFGGRGEWTMEGWTITDPWQNTFLVRS
jgi:catechol 2,3-dioxygenase